MLLTINATGSGVVARADEPGRHYYAARLLQTGVVEVVRVHDGLTTVLGSTTATIAPLVSHSLRLRASGGTPVTLAVAFDGAPVLSGGPGLLSGSSQRSQYDNFKVVVPRPPPAVGGDTFDGCTSSTNLGPGWVTDGRWSCLSGKARGEAAGGTAFFVQAVPADVTVRARVQLNGVATNSGVFARQTGSSFYAARISSAGRLEIVQVTGGITTVLATANVAITSSVFHRVGLRVAGSGVVRLEAELDGLLVTSVNDAAPTRLTAGRAGLLSGSGARTAYDDFAVLSP